MRKVQAPIEALTENNWTYYRTMVCSLCEKDVASSTMSVRQHALMHIRRGDLAESDKRSFETELWSEGRKRAVERRAA